MRLGLSSLAAASSIYFPDVDAYAGLEIIAKQGFSHIEYSDQTQPSYLDTPEGELAKIRSHAADLGLTLWSAHSPCGRFDLTADDPAKRQEAIEAHRRSLDGLAVLGIPHFVIHQVGGGNMDKSEKVKLGLEAVHDLREHARQYEILLLIENFVAFDAHDLVSFLAQTGDEGIGICIDTGHEWQVGRNPAKAIRVAGDHLVSLHIQDNHGKGSADEHLPPTYGTTDWPEVMKALSEVGYAGPYMMEVIPHVRPASEMTPRQLVRVCYETMSKIVEEHGQ